ncbi:hypothetical protein [Mesobacillus zeae]|uniref:hypothetical protein n=1 Tax=Mesobacillus zeae TaxID=1917180 RepID=UPI0015E702A4|nr:hypothetical protein [Mesobacillus zeae]
MNPIPIRRKNRTEAEKAVTELISRGCEVIVPVTEVKTSLQKSVAVVYFAKLRKVE